MMVHVDVAETVDALLRGDALAPELRWRDEAGVHRTQARPKPGPQTPAAGPAAQMPGERFGGLVSAGTPGWRPEPGWRPGAARPGQAGFREADPGAARPGYRPGAGGGWRATRGRGPRGREGGPSAPWEGDSSTRAVAERGAPAPFLIGGIADRGPLERGTPPPPEPRARDAREFQRQAAWRASAERALDEVDRPGRRGCGGPRRGAPRAGGDRHGRRARDPPPPPTTATRRRGAAASPRCPRASRPTRGRPRNRTWPHGPPPRTRRSDEDEDDGDDERRRGVRHPPG